MKTSNKYFSYNKKGPIEFSIKPLSLYRTLISIVLHEAVKRLIY